MPLPAFLTNNGVSAPAPYPLENIIALFSHRDDDGSIAEVRPAIRGSSPAPDLVADPGTYTLVYEYVIVPALVPIAGDLWE